MTLPTPGTPRPPGEPERAARAGTHATPLPAVRRSGTSPGVSCPRPAHEDTQWTPSPHRLSSRPPPPPTEDAFVLALWCHCHLLRVFIHPPTSHQTSGSGGQGPCLPLEARLTWTLKSTKGMRSPQDPAATATCDEHLASPALCARLQSIQPVHQSDKTLIYSARGGGTGLICGGGQGWRRDEAEGTARHGRRAPRIGPHPPLQTPSFRGRRARSPSPSSLPG